MYSQTQIKKFLYQQNPTGRFQRIIGGQAQYAAYFYPFPNSEVEVVSFYIPLSEMGNAEFSRDMESKLLIKWMQEM